MNSKMVNELIELIRDTNTYYDLNYDDVANWINDNKEILIKFLNERQSD